MAELPAGYKDIPEEDRKKAKVFNDRARTVADTGNYEYAIEMYLQGLRIDPDALDAHQALREVSLRRKAMGGKPMSMKQKWDLPKPAKDDYRQAMLNAEKQLAYDPGNDDHMLAVVTNAQKGGYYDTVIWMGDHLFQALMELPEKKRDFSKFQSLKDVYVSIQDYRRAINTLAAAMKLRPSDMDLQSELKDLSTRATIKEGNYEAGDFRQSMRDPNQQRDLLIADMDIRSLDAMAKPIADAEAAYAQDPSDPARFARLVDLLRKTETLEYENRAIELLEQKYRDTKSYKYKQSIGLIQIAQMARTERTLREQVNANPGDVNLKKELNQFLRDRAEQELAFFRETAANYPTDSSAKFEMARRLFVLGRFDEAIPVFQVARDDPKYRAQSGIFLGRSFLEAQFYDEAVDTLAAAIQSYPVKTGDEKSIELHYWYARALEEKGDRQTAAKSYSQVAQWNFTYRDVQQRIKRLRAMNNPNNPPPGNSGASGGAGPTSPAPQEQASAPGAGIV